MQEEQRISAAIEAYLKAIKTGEQKHFTRAFYSDSVVINAGEEETAKAVIPIAKFTDRVRNRHKDGIFVEEIPLEMTVSHIGKVANVRLDFELKIGNQTLYGTDFFNLVKRNGEWKISQKIYDVTHTT